MTTKRGNLKVSHLLNRCFAGGGQLKSEPPCVMVFPGLIGNEWTGDPG